MRCEIILVYFQITAIIDPKFSSHHFFMRKTIIYFILLVSYATQAQNTNSLSGKITDVQSQPLVGVTIHLLNTNLGAATDEQGSFVLVNIPYGKYRAQITAVGFASQTIELSIGSASEDILTIQLQESVSQLEDVVITAQKQEEDKQKVPFAVSVVSSQQVQQYRLWNSRDITAIVPNLYSTNSGDGRNVTSIRGITSTSYDPAVTTYIDGVSQFGLDTYIAQLFDVERIEVLSGPQGTLYGRNAMAGVINIITKQPSSATTGFAEINIGNYGQQRFAGSFRTPIIKDKLYLGVTSVYDRSNGFYTNRFNNTDFDTKNSFSGNYFLKYNVNSRWMFTLNLKHNENRNYGAFPLAGSRAAAFDKPFTVNQNAITEMVDNIFNTSLVVNYTGRAFNFSSQTAYQSNYRYYADPIDSDFSPLDAITTINNYGDKWNNVKVLTQELKFSSSAASLLKWTAGTYLFHQDNPTKQATRFGKDAGLLGISDTNFSTIASTKGESNGIAFFGQATYAIAKRIDLTAGLRYDYERKKQNILGEYQKDSNPTPIFETRPDTSAIATYNAFSPKVSLAYHLTDHCALYISYGRGYRVGGLTPLSSDPSVPPLYAYKPEYSNNIEVGSKNVFLANRLQVNLSLFYVKVSDVQVPTLVLPDAVTITKNAGGLTSKGMDLQLSAIPMRNLQIDYNFGLNDAAYTTLKLSQNGNEVDLKGAHQIFTPAFTSMLAVQYSYSIGNAKLTVRGEWQHLGKQYFDLANTIEQSSYHIFNTRVGVGFRKFEIQFWVRNLGDEKYIAYAYDFGATHLGNPRNYGITLRWSF
jgi:iron complex outermembrane recepter protein